MTPGKKRTGSTAPPSIPSPLPASREPQAPAPGGKRKAWIRRTPVEVVLDQISKQRDRVRELEEQFNREKRELEKLEGARRLLEEE